MRWEVHSGLIPQREGINHSDRCEVTLTVCSGQQLQVWADFVSHFDRSGNVRAPALPAHAVHGEI